MTFKRIMGFCWDPTLGKSSSEKAPFYLVQHPVSQFILALKSPTGSKDKHAYLPQSAKIQPCLPFLI